jgi:hypothetical protein
MADVRTANIMLRGGCHLWDNCAAYRPDGTTSVADPRTSGRAYAGRAALRRVANPPARVRRAALRRDRGFAGNVYTHGHAPKSQHQQWRHGYSDHHQMERVDYHTSPETSCCSSCEQGKVCPAECPGGHE